MLSVFTSFFPVNMCLRCFFARPFNQPKSTKRIPKPPNKFPSKITKTNSPDFWPGVRQVFDQGRIDSCLQVLPERRKKQFCWVHLDEKYSFARSTLDFLIYVRIEVAIAFVIVKVIVFSVITRHPGLASR